MKKITFLRRKVKRKRAIKLIFEPLVDLWEKYVCWRFGLLVDQITHSRNIAISWNISRAFDVFVFLRTVLITLVLILLSLGVSVYIFTTSSNMLHWIFTTIPIAVTDIWQPVTTRISRLTQKSMWQALALCRFMQEADITGTSLREYLVMCWINIQKSNYSDNAEMKFFCKKNSVCFHPR